MYAVFHFQLFDKCLEAENQYDGVGMDNMTAIIVQFNRTDALKRSASNTECDNTKCKLMKTSHEQGTSKVLKLGIQC